MTTAVRIAALLLGLWCLAYGGWQLSDHNTDDLKWIAIWCATGILLHDGVFAPLSAAVGLGGRLLLPRAWWAPVGCGLVCTVTLLLVSFPVLRRGHARPDNPTVLDRDYPLGLLIAVSAVWLLVLGVLIGGAALRRRRGSAMPANDVPR